MSFKIVVWLFINTFLVSAPGICSVDGSVTPQNILSFNSICSIIDSYEYTSAMTLKTTKGAIYQLHICINIKDS